MTFGLCAPEDFSGFRRSLPGSGFLVQKQAELDPDFRPAATARTLFVPGKWEGALKVIFQKPSPGGIPRCS